MNRQVILNFHGLGTPHAGVDPDERRFWISQDRFAEIVDVALAHRNARHVVWSFDDGNRSDLTIAAPLLAARGQKGLFFLLIGRLDDPRYLSGEDARTLDAMGMTIGLHGRDHVVWKGLDPATLTAETIESRKVLADHVGKPVDTVAIPFGAYNRRVIAHLRQSGFARIFTSDGGWARAGDRFGNRTSMRADHTLDAIRALLDDDAPLKARLRRKVSTFARRNLI